MFKTLLIAIVVSFTAACHFEGTNPITIDALDSVDFTKKEVINLGRLVAVAYKQFDGASDVYNPPFPSEFVGGYTPFANLVARDNRREKRDEFYGHLSWQKGQTRTLVISIRGTSDVHEWVADAKFFKTSYNNNRAYGNVELGFKEVFSSFKVATPDTINTLFIDDYLVSLGKLKRVIVVGHSLGSSLATLLAFDIATSGYAETVKLLTYASPLTGDKSFVNSFNSNILNSARILNRPDIVTRVPPESLEFRHVEHELEINSHNYDHIKRSVLCYHSIQTYLNIVSEGEIALDPKCRQSNVGPQET